MFTYFFLINCIKNNTVIISVIICTCIGSCCLWCSLVRSDKFWLGELYVLCIVLLWELLWGKSMGHIYIYIYIKEKKKAALWDDRICPHSPIHLLSWQNLLAYQWWLLKSWKSHCLTNRPKNKQWIRFVFELWFASYDFKLDVASKR